MTTKLNATSRLSTKIEAAATPPNMNMIKAFMNSLISEGNSFKLVRATEDTAVFSAKHLTMDTQGLGFMDKTMRHFGDRARVTFSVEGGQLMITFLDIERV